MPEKAHIPETVGPTQLAEFLGISYEHVRRLTEQGVFERVTVHESTRSAVIQHDGGNLIFSDFDKRSEETKRDDTKAMTGIQCSRRFFIHSLDSAQSPFFLERRDGITWEERYSGADRNGVPLDPSHPKNANLSEDERRKRQLEINDFVAAKLANRRGGDNAGK